MRGYPASIRQFSCLVALAMAPLCAIHATDVKSARVWAGPEYTRLVLDVSGPLDYKTRQDGDQLVIDLGRSALGEDYSAPKSQGLLKGLDSNQQGNRLQLVAKVDPSSHYKSFVLQPQASYGYRLVVDVYPGSGVASSAKAAPAPAPVQDDSDDDAAPPPAPVTIKVAASSKNSLRSTQSGMASTRQAAALLNGERKVVVAVDAGHGGQDPGAHGPGGTLEKNVTLAVARELAAQINKQPGMKAVLTRDADFFIPLKQRYEIARRNNADLFVSVHADAFVNGDAKGSSVWVLSPRGKTSEAARWLADRENRADLIGGVSLDDKDDSLAAVLLDLQQGYAMQASEAVATNVLKALGGLGPTHRGFVERANFVVLRSPDVPSILVETAFISNPDEERKLRDPSHQAHLAEAVMGGVRSYFEATPPPGSWFAAQASRRNGNVVASAAKNDDDDGDGNPVSTAANKAVAQAMTGSKSGEVKVASVKADSERADANVRDLHRVTAGESLRSIARQYGVSITALKNANRSINSDTVRAGMVLAIPSG
ncbi:N-acetylmuramoyl-L-alanine amidase [Dyella sp. LX-66]|uniref:N-acetylmuramoyl-L-alanine amidase n=1 Tax=unclassified Dyella TaxID=2634549 RepID=UPI001BDFB018|nr:MULTISPECIES: N-acetylmuramoyl-L-alanine amidase [unclassified Dyella]MBT2117843.1 N-acetylmuramoyl-L-alanine amidase [Dyella sp. LX-1]MBT2142262.1 N-acetylmuramoyl-L-alanine amidase [Dyella sp. LX-66]